MDTKDNYSNRIEHTVYTLVLGVVVILAGHRIKWANCAMGFLWVPGYSCTYSRGGLLAQVAQKLLTRY